MTVSIRKKGPRIKNTPLQRKNTPNAGDFNIYQPKTIIKKWSN